MIHVNITMKFYAFLIVLFYAEQIQSEQINVKELRCLVCQRVVEEMEKEVEKVDPLKKVEVGTYRFDHEGNQQQRTVQYRRSEVYLTELIENVCEKMKDFVRARMKSSRKLVVLPLFVNGGKMNPLISEVDIIQDSDLNKSLQFYCEGILEENEEVFIKHFSEGGNNLDIKLCSDAAKLCNHSLDQEYEFEANDEL